MEQLNPYKLWNTTVYNELDDWRGAALYCRVEKTCILHNHEYKKFNVLITV